MQRPAGLVTSGLLSKAPLHRAARVPEPPAAHRPLPLALSLLLPPPIHASMVVKSLAAANVPQTGAFLLLQQVGALSNADWAHLFGRKHAVDTTLSQMHQ